jgi:hypothetical protein
MGKREYIDFKLYLTRPPDGKGACQVSLLPTPRVGETITPVTVSAGKGPSADDPAYLANKSITLRKLVAFGKSLANWLLPEDTVRGLFAEALKRAGNDGGVRLRLIIADHSLKEWPWEYAYFDPLGGPDSMRGFLALDPRVSIVRHEPLPFPHPEREEAKTEPMNLRMVVAAASPKGQAELQLDREISIIKQALQDFEVDGVRIIPDPVLMDATPVEVADALRGAGSTFVFHFAGHGITEIEDDPFTRGGERVQGYLLFIDDKSAKTAKKVKADDLARYLQQAGVRLAVLGACYSGLRNERYPWDNVAGALAARGIPAIISMQYAIIDTYAIKFSRAFYGALASGLSLDEAMTFGRLTMYDETSLDLGKPTKTEWGVPVLYSRLRDGIVLPERIGAAGDTADRIRTIIDQTVGHITATGRVVGVSADQVTEALQIKQQADRVDGSLVGLEAKTLEPGSSTSVEQDAGTVSGSMTGVKLDNL